MIPKLSKTLINRLSRSNYETLNTIEISKDNILANLELIRKQHKKSSIIPVLKSNAYGHGIVQVASILNHAKCDLLAVDGYFEAAKIKHITKHRVLVLGYIKPSNVKLLDVAKCSFVVQDEESLKAFGGLHKTVRVHIELNTGMNRLGLAEAEIDGYCKILKQYPKLQLEGIMSHLADADNEKDDTFTNSQVIKFDGAVEKILAQGFRPKYIHIAQTAGSTKAASKYANTIRLGIGLYGINPLQEKDMHYQDLAPLKPALTLKSTIVKVASLKQGDKVSYNGIFTAPRNMQIGVLPLGYYEGVPRELSNKGSVTINGTVMPIVGRVCMNHTMIELDRPGHKVGEEVVMISSVPSECNSVEQICKVHKLFSYTLVTKLSSSVRRVIT